MDRYLNMKSNKSSDTQLLEVSICLWIVLTLLTNFLTDCVCVETDQNLFSFLVPNTAIFGGIAGHFHFKPSMDFSFSFFFTFGRKRKIMVFV